MENQWIVPLTLIPGIGLFIMSTTNLSISLSNEINDLINQEECKRALISKKINQLVLINISLVGFYISAFCFAISGLLGHVEANYESNFLFIQPLEYLALASLVISSIILIIFSARAVSIKKLQFLERLEE
ncbi:MAG TPA: hypothetical protein ACFCUD_13145 [Cyclobacteriaceae bacterium]